MNPTVTRVEGAMTPTEFGPLRLTGDAPPAPCPEVVELTLLLAWGEFLELEQTAYAAGITVSLLIRRTVRDYLRRERESHPMVVR